ncbi:MAG: hypothetical protein AAGG00_07885 [Cyanobacteria bacterium P01_H01_bin.150]
MATNPSTELLGKPPEPVMINEFYCRLVLRAIQLLAIKALVSIWFAGKSVRLF